MQAHAAHAQAAARGSGMVMPPQSGPMMSNGPDEQAMAMGPGGMMLQPQLVQVPASAAGMHPQYQAFDGMHMQQAPMHQVRLFSFSSNRCTFGSDLLFSAKSPCSSPW